MYRSMIFLVLVGLFLTKDSFGLANSIIAAQNLANKNGKAAADANALASKQQTSQWSQYIQDYATEHKVSFDEAKRQVALANNIDPNTGKATAGGNAVRAADATASTNTTTDYNAYYNSLLASPSPSPAPQTAAANRTTNGTQAMGTATAQSAPADAAAQNSAILGQLMAMPAPHDVDQLTQPLAELCGRLLLATPFYSKCLGLIPATVVGFMNGNQPNATVGAIFQGMLTQIPMLPPSFSMGLQAALATGERGYGFIGAAQPTVGVTGQSVLIAPSPTPDPVDGPDMATLFQALFTQ